MRPKSFFVNGGAGRVLCSIPAFEKYQEEHPDEDFLIICEGGTDFFKGHPTLYGKVYDHWHKNIFRDKLISTDVKTPEPYRVWEYYNQKCNLSQAFDIEINGKGVRELPKPTIKLSKENEPDIYGAIRRNALLENVTVDSEGKIDFDDNSRTENTRVSYPIDHIDNIVKGVSRAGHAKKVIFLTADAFGVLPPVAKLTPAQTEYYFLSGFTAKLAGTERGITEPTPTFSSCFGAAFLSLHPTQYAQVLQKRMSAVGAEAYLVNTGWNGTGKRISIKDTRAIIDSILDGSIDHAETTVVPMFNLAVPNKVEGVTQSILDPRNTYEDSSEWQVKAADLAKRFVNNFEKFTDTDNGKSLVSAGPQL